MVLPPRHIMLVVFRSRDCRYRAGTYRYVEQAKHDAGLYHRGYKYELVETRG